jgi:hypothetical protein
MQRTSERSRGLIIIERSPEGSPSGFRPEGALITRLHTPTGIVLQKSNDAFIPLPELPARVVFKGDLTSTESPSPANLGREKTEVTLPISNIQTRELYITEERIAVGTELGDIEGELERAFVASEYVDLGQDVPGRYWRAKIIRHGFEDPLVSAS